MRRQSTTNIDKLVDNLENDDEASEKPTQFRRPDEICAW